MSDNKQMFILNGFLKEGNRLLMEIKDKFGITKVIDGPQREMHWLKLQADIEGHNQVIWDKTHIRLTNNRLQPMSQTTS